MPPKNTKVVSSRIRELQGQCKFDRRGPALQPLTAQELVEEISAVKRANRGDDNDEFADDRMYDNQNRPAKRRSIEPSRYQNNNDDDDDDDDDNDDESDEEDNEQQTSVVSALSSSFQPMALLASSYSAKNTSNYSSDQVDEQPSARAVALERSGPSLLHANLSRPRPLTNRRPPTTASLRTRILSKNVPQRQQHDDDNEQDVVEADTDFQRPISPVQRPMSPVQRPMSPVQRPTTPISALLRPVPSPQPVPARPEIQPSQLPRMTLRRTPAREQPSAPSSVSASSSSSSPGVAAMASVWSQRVAGKPFAPATAATAASPRVVLRTLDTTSDSKETEREMASLREQLRASNEALEMALQARRQEVEDLRSQLRSSDKAIQTSACAHAQEVALLRDQLHAANEVVAAARRAIADHQAQLHENRATIEQLQQQQHAERGSRERATKNQTASSTADRATIDRLQQQVQDLQDALNEQQRIVAAAAAVTPRTPRTAGKARRAPQPSPSVRRTPLKAAVESLAECVQEVLDQTERLSQPLALPRMDF